MGSLSDLLQSLAAEEDAGLQAAIACGEAPSCSVEFPDPPPPSKKLEEFEGDYVPGIKIRVSGLSERSWGDGCDRRTVVHAVLIKPLEAGRLKRSPKEFLCTKRGATWGRQAVPGQELTCERCIEIAARLDLKACTDKRVSRLVDCY